MIQTLRYSISMNPTISLSTDRISDRIIDKEFFFPDPTLTQRCGTYNISLYPALLDLVRKYAMK